MGKSGGKKNARSQVKAGQRKAKRLSRDNPNMLRRVRDKELVAPDLGSYRTTMDARGRTETAEESAAKARRRAEKRAEMIALGLAPADGDDDEVRISNAPEGKRKWYFRELMKVIEASDVIIQVLDARDPLGCRALDVERRILAQQTSDGAPSKRLVLVLNKIDLVPPPVVADWVAYLRREHPTVAFKSSTGGGRGHLASLDVKASKASTKALDTKASVGGQALLQLLKNYSRSLDVKKGLTVGIIGYPNVGKSSIINSLKMARAVQVSSAAGCTKSLQQVRLDSNIMLVDSPGVLFAADDVGVASSADALSEDAVRERTQSLLLRNVLRVDQIADPIVAVQGIMARCTPEQLQSIYGVAEYGSDREFLYFVAHRMGKIGKGGIPNLEEAARVVLKDWNAGKIPFYTTPPAIEDVRESTLVSGFSESFDVAGLLDAANTHAVNVIREGAAANGGQIMGVGDDDDDDEETGRVAVNDDDGDNNDDDEDDDDDGFEEEDDAEISEALGSAIATASAGMADEDADVDALLAAIAPDAFARVGRAAEKAEKAFNGRTMTATAAANAASAARRPATSAMESVGRLISTRAGRSKAYKVSHDEAYLDIPASSRNNKAALKKAKKDQRRAAAAAAGGYGADMDDGIDI